MLGKPSPLQQMVSRMIKGMNSIKGGEYENFDVGTFECGNVDNDFLR